MEIADENAKLRRATEALRLKSAEAEQSARELSAANDRLKTVFGYTPELSSVDVFDLWRREAGL